MQIPVSFPASLLDERELVLVTGKGGTGKSTLTAALAALAAQRDSKILVGGSITSWYNKAGTSLSRGGIVRLNADGSLDTFNSSIGADGTVNAIAVQKDGRIIIGGSFTHYNGTARGEVARLWD